jgi:hypothetical protein
MGATLLDPYRQAKPYQKWNTKFQWRGTSDRMKIDGRSVCGEARPPAARRSGLNLAAA